MINFSLRKYPWEKHSLIISDITGIAGFLPFWIGFFALLVSPSWSLKWAAVFLFGIVNMIISKLYKRKDDESKKKMIDNYRKEEQEEIRQFAGFINQLGSEETLEIFNKEDDAPIMTPEALNVMANIYLVNEHYWKGLYLLEKAVYYWKKNRTSDKPLEDAPSTAIRQVATLKNTLDLSRSYSSHGAYARARIEDPNGRDLSPEDIFLIGSLYEEQKHFKKSLYLYQKSADLGYAKAQTKTGAIYLYGETVAKDEDLAIGWLKKASAQEEPEAQRLLGQAYYNGTIITRDEEKAYKLMLLSANQGDLLAEAKMATFCQFGVGLKEPDIPLSAYWQKKFEMNCEKLGIR